MRQSTSTLLRSFTLVLGCALLPACDDPAGQSHAEVDEDAELHCGGLLGMVCPDGLECIDDPSDGCYPQKGGADCLGLCKEPDEGDCGGPDGATCGDGELCADDPTDDCDPANGDADCPGVCQAEPGPQVCSLLFGVPCPDGLVCTDDPDDCDPLSGEDCPGTCRPPVEPAPQAVSSMIAVTPPPLAPCEAPTRSYVSREADTCAMVQVLCEPGYALFKDGCGCGCEALPTGPETPTHVGALSAAP